MTRIIEGKPAMEWIRDAVIESLDKQYDLVYVDRGDRFTDEQIEALARTDFESFYDDINDWEADSMWHGVQYVYDEAVKAVIDTLDDEGDEWMHDSLHDEFRTSDEADEVRQTIRDRDSGAHYEDLANGAGYVLMRHNVVDEDHAWVYQAVTPEEFLDRVGFERTAFNLSSAASVIANASPEYGVGMVEAVYAMSVRDLYDLTWEADAEVRITNPHLWLGNPFVGSGMLEPFEGTLTVRRGDMNTDKGAWGYGWGDVAGAGTAGMEATVEQVAA